MTVTDSNSKHVILVGKVFGSAIRSSDIVDLVTLEGAATCSHPPNYPIRTREASVNILNGCITVCGGWGGLPGGTDSVSFRFFKSGFKL